MEKCKKVLFRPIITNKIITRFAITGTIAAFSLLSSACATFVVGVGSHRGVSVSTSVDARNLKTRSSAATRQNNRIKARIRRIVSSYRFDSRLVTIKVSRGLVVLRGSVPSRSIEQDIVRRTVVIPGVHTVRSKLRIRHSYNR